MNKTFVTGAAVVVVVAAAGGTYAVLHTPKRQFETNLTKMSKSDDNIANFNAKVSGDADATAGVKGKIKIDAKDKNKMDMVMTLNEKKKSQTMRFKANKHTAYVSAAFLTSTYKTYGLGKMSKALKSIDHYWIKATDADASYKNVKTTQVRSDADKTVKWFKDLDGSKFKKVSDGYQVKLNKADLKSLMTVVYKTKSGKEMTKSEWKEAKSSLDDIKNLKFNITLGDKGHLMKMYFSGKEDGEVGRMNFKTTTKRDNNYRVKMPAKKDIKSTSQLMDIVEDKMVDYYADQYGSDDFSSMYGSYDDDDSASSSSQSSTASI